ncbi:MAG: hypothetical protein E3J35_00695 [Methanomassiliicoccales archaeon]|nr:MAG: hypothetical protein E3J35_00695 [Methanomassiliicoccales archaeon]
MVLCQCCLEMPPKKKPIVRSLNEQRRLMYVAITRAKLRLIVSTWNQASQADAAHACCNSWLGRPRDCASQTESVSQRTCPNTNAPSPWTRFRRHSVASLHQVSRYLWERCFPASFRIEMLSGMMAIVSGSNFWIFAESYPFFSIISSPFL